MYLLSVIAVDIFFEMYSCRLSVLKLFLILTATKTGKTPGSSDFPCKSFYLSAQLLYCVAWLFLK